ncbi:BQ2448_7295 [Microbotryum intermedium]|uniref:DNA polymerase kappa n=1 Tax=Microbotryum intermedium TaxID=269621 RepID=A0A238FKP5_9BASI|nr:BQ2448_7295 [Microbotryum intermedium]
MPDAGSPTSSRSTTAADLLPFPSHHDGHHHSSSNIRMTLASTALPSASANASCSSSSSSLSGQHRSVSVPIASTSKANNPTSLARPISPRKTPSPRAPARSQSMVPERVATPIVTTRAVDIVPLTKDPKNKGKAKALDQKEPSVSLMRRLAGPSDQKAGLLRDKDEVKQIIYEASKGSAYFKQQEKRDAELTLKVDAMVSRLEGEVKSRRGNLRAEEAMVDAMIAEMEKTRVLSETIVVVDADAFYASCHQREDPSLVGKAFGVGGGSGGGVLTTASYEARRYGCSSAMAGFVAKRLCPHILFVKPDFSLYTKCSKEIFCILAKYGQISPASLDEAYCSLTDYCEREKCPPAVAAERMRAEILQETGLSVSAGVSPNAMLSKVAAERNKPNGQCVIAPTAEACCEFARSLRIRQVPGIGRVSERVLHAVGVHTVADVYRERGKLFLIREKIGLTFLLSAYLGIGRTEITHANREDRKGISVERTFSASSDLAGFYARLKNIADALAEDCQEAEFSGRTITLKLKYDNYDLISRATTLGPSIYTNDARTLYREGKRLLEKEVEGWKKERAKGNKTKGGDRFALRLIGLRVSNLRDMRALREGKGKIEDWVGQGKRRGPEDGRKKEGSKIQRTKLENDEAMTNIDEAEGIGEGNLGLGGHALKMEDTEPASSDPLWASFDHDLDDDEKDGDEGFLSEIDALASEYGPVDTTFKPFFTAGESLNAKKEAKREGPAPEKDQLRFAEREVLVLSDSDDDDDGDEKDDVGQEGERRKKQLRCPVCFKSFAGSEVALSAHVAAHFDERQASGEFARGFHWRRLTGFSHGKLMGIPRTSSTGKKRKVQSELRQQVTTSKVTVSSRRPAASGVAAGGKLFKPK